jgi:hypothetical protein
LLAKEIRSPQSSHTVETVALFPERRQLTVAFPLDEVTSFIKVFDNAPFASGAISKPFSSSRISSGVPPTAVAKTGNREVLSPSHPKNFQREKIVISKNQVFFASRYRFACNDPISCSEAGGVLLMTRKYPIEQAAKMFGRLLDKTKMHPF